LSTKTPDNKPVDPDLWAKQFLVGFFAFAAVIMLIRYLVSWLPGT